MVTDIFEHALLNSYSFCSVFNYLLDDNPLPANEASSSVLVATYSHSALQNGKGVITGGLLTSNVETEKGLLTLITTDAPGIQVYVSCIDIYYEVFVREVNLT